MPALAVMHWAVLCPQQTALSREAHHAAFRASPMHDTHTALRVDLQALHLHTSSARSARHWARAHLLLRTAKP